jgi:sugar phosphate isomerase/epimerase
MLRELNRPNVRLQIDTADQNITDPNVSDAVRKVVKHVDYVHYSDNEGYGIGLTHNIPGHGSMNWRRFVTELRDGGYNGYLTAQLYAGHPIDPDAWQEECFQYMTKILEQCECAG